MSGEKRRAVIVRHLEQANAPISASTFAKECAVSRQVIVGDIALLRAAGSAVRATAKGYVLVKESGSDYLGKVACQHRLDQTADELNLIVSLGGSVIDVAVEHDYYGELVGNLDIKTPLDVVNFIQIIEKGQARLLSDLTGGIHLHTLGCRDEEHFQSIKQALADNQFLYQEK